MFHWFGIYSVQLIQSIVVWHVARSRSRDYETVRWLNEYCAFPIFVVPIFWTHWNHNWPLYTSLPPSAPLTSHRPFRETVQETQAENSGRIRLESVHFLWVCLMGLPDSPPDNDDLVQSAMRLDVVNQAIWDPYTWKLSNMSHWKEYMFHFGVEMSQLFQADVSIKLHRFMRRVEQHLIHMCCLRRGSSEDN